MIAARIALFVGLFVAPAILLRMGHGLRHSTQREKRRFWGGVSGHLAGLMLAVAVMIAPPIAWDGGSLLREMTVHWSMVLGFMIGMLAGPLIGGRISTR